MSVQPLFRIERKQTLEQRRAEKQKLTAVQEVRQDQLTIGTRSSADLVLDDPVAAEQHCCISYIGGQFRLRELSNATGTFLNGIRVDGECTVGPGDRIALGVSTIALIAGDQAHELNLHVREGAFFFAIKKRGEFQSDADEWVRSEVRFGRKPLLTLLNVTVGALALVTVLWLWFRPSGQAALQPGHLSSPHAALFSDSPPTSAHLADAVAVAQANGCAACHESYGQPTASKCAACHEDVVRSAEATEAHPFETGQALECGNCHREHHGATPPPGTLHPTDITQQCSDCHGDDFADEAGLLEGIALATEKFRLAPTDGTRIARRTSVGFEAFAHGSHAKLDCGDCHQESADSNGPDFGAVDFEHCMTCHSSNATFANTALLPSADLRWDTTWHGAGPEAANCRACHSEPYTAELATVERLPAVSASFTLGLRSHSEQFNSQSPPQDCRTCHKAGDVLESGRLSRERPFRHAQHLSALWPEDDSARTEWNRQCAECHTDMRTSEQLTSAPAAYAGPSVASCELCHVDSGMALITQPGQAETASPTRLSNAFPHARHDAVEGGCFACHEFAADDSALVQTPADVVTCVRCHVKREGELNTAHAFLGGSGSTGCDACHSPRGSAEPAAPMAEIFYGPISSDQPPSDFPHFLEAHRGATCTECHGTPDAESEVYSPTESAASCRECHARNRFHWR